jgi:N-acetylneuraminic acid mutarotase
MEMKFKLFSFLSLSYLLVACSDNYEFLPIQSWTQLNNFPGVARASATSFVYEDKAFVCLGRSGSKYDFLKDVWEYDSKDDSWTRKTDFPGSARVKAIGAVIGDKAYVGLGAIAPFDGNQFSDFWEYDIKNDSWKQVASFPGTAKNDLFCAVIDSCIYTTEGFTATSFNADTYKYNPKINSWTRLKDCPVSRSSSAGFNIGTNFYVGTGYYVGNYKDFYCYNTLTDNWTRMADAPECRILSKGIAINGKGYILLGRYWHGMLDGGKLLKDIIEYDPQQNKWVCCGDFPGGGRQNMVVFTINGKGYIIGGEDDKERKSDVWEFQP